MKDVHVFEVYTSEWRQEWGLDKRTVNWTAAKLISFSEICDKFAGAECRLQVLIIERWRRLARWFEHHFSYFRL